MDGYPNLTKVVIAGITIKDDNTNINFIQKWEWSDSFSGEPIKTITIICPRTVTSILDISSDNLLTETNEVLIYRGVSSSDETLVFRGIITDFKKDISKVTIECADMLYTATKKDVTYSYDKDVDPSAGVLSEIFKDLINTYTDLVADNDSVINSGTILTREKIICKSDNVYNVIKTQIADPLGWNFYYSPITNKVHFEPFGYKTNKTTIKYGVNLVNNPVWDYDKDNLYNIIKVYGAEQEIQTIEEGQIGVTAGYTTSSVQLAQIPSTVRVLCDSSNPPTTEKVAGVPDSTQNYDYSIDVTKKQIIWNTDVYTPNSNDYCQIIYTFNRPKPIAIDSPESQEKYNCKNTLTVIKDELKEVSDARLFAMELLNKHKNPVISTTLKVTNVSDLNPGQKVRVIDSINNIDQYFIVTKITKKYPYTYDEVDVYSEILEKDDFFITIARKIKELDRQAKDDFEYLIQIKTFSNTFIYENRWFKITKSMGSEGKETIFLENSEKRYVELFYDTEFINDYSEAILDTTNRYLKIEYPLAIQTTSLLCDWPMFNFKFAADGYWSYAISDDDRAMLNFVLLNSAYDLTDTFSIGTYNLQYILGFPEILRGVCLNADGSKLYVSGQQNNKIYEINLNVNYNVVSGMTYNSVNFEITGEFLIRSIQFSNTGTKLFVSVESGDLDEKIQVYNLSTGFDLSTAELEGSYIICKDMVDFTIYENVLYIVNNVGTIKKYSLSESYDLSTAVLVSEYNMGNFSHPITSSFVLEDGSFCWIPIKVYGSTRCTKYKLKDPTKVISELIAYDLENPDTNTYKSCNISIVGTGLDNLKFYIGEYDGIDITYSEVTLIGTTTSRTGNIYLNRNNNYGINWKAECFNGIVIISKLDVRY